ncbi:MAG: DUF2484 family protein [Pseudomonadota bacterium]
MSLSWPLVTGALWVIAATITALLPMRLQYPPGITLLVAAPIIILWIGWEHGWVVATLGLLAFASMFRNPLRYFYKKWRGLPVELPPELRQVPPEDRSDENSSAVAREIAQ